MVVYIYNGKEYRIPIYNMILILPGRKSCILLTYFQGQVAGSHSKCVTEFLVATAGNGARIYPFFRTLPNSFHLNNNTSRSTLLLCRHEKKLINCINLKPVQKKKKNAHQIMNSLACGAMLFGSATSIADERDKKRSIVIMIILMEVLLASILIGGDTNS